MFVSISQCLLCGVLLPELLVVVLADFLDHVQCLSDQLLLDDLQEFVLLQGLTGNIQREIVRVHLQSIYIMSNLDPTYRYIVSIVKFCTALLQA